MATTPEGKVKQKVREVLARYKGVYLYMPVPTGFGKTTLDFLGCYNRLFFAIETKKKDGVLTEKQKITIKELMRAGAMVFLIKGVDDPEFGRLIFWLETFRRDSDDTHQPPA